MTWICVAVLALVAVPGTVASKTTSAGSLSTLQMETPEAHGSLISIVRSSIMARFEATPMSSSSADDEPEHKMMALKGAGGGLDILEAKEDGDSDKSVYRPWKTRFDLQPFDYNSNKYLRQPENRMSYRRLYAANPRMAEAPNARDRHAQSDVIMVFGLTAIVAVMSAVLIITKLEVLRADELNIVSYQNKMLQVIVCAAVPWLLLGLYLLTTFVSFVGQPMRHPGGTYHWQCSAMTWFIFVAPAVNFLYFTAHAIWISRIFFSVEQQAPMGRMFSLGIMPDNHPGHDAVTRITNIASHSGARQVLFILELMCAIIGYTLITFRWGANAQYCQPEVYWATVALCVTVTIVIVFTTLAFVCSIIIRACSVSPWLEDFADSFWQGSLEAKISRNEAREQRMGAKAQAKAAQDEYEDQFKQWLAFHEEHAEERKRHEEIHSEHQAYLEATKGAPQQGAPQPMVQDSDSESISEATFEANPSMAVQEPSTVAPGSFYRRSQDGGDTPPDRSDGSTLFATSAAPQLAFNMPSQMVVTQQSYGAPMMSAPMNPMMTAPSMPHGTLPPQFFSPAQGPAFMPPGSLPPASLQSLPYGSPQHGAYAYRGGPMASAMSPVMLPGAPMGSTPGFMMSQGMSPGPPGTLPPGNPFGSLPPGYFPGTLPPRPPPFSDDGSDGTEDSRNDFARAGRLF